ncbi:MAG: ParB/RepB/Spo0J family partition protein [Rhizobiales bacterium]|nr:ParB/RepB/Spo0J family partition protein [Hyphomicrobiales bacterium]
MGRGAGNGDSPPPELIGEGPQQIQPRIPAEGEQRSLPVAQLRSSRFNPRKDFGEQELAELAESIRTKGMVQPIVVRPHPEEPQAFEIVAGERRWRAAQKAAMHMVPVIVRDLSDRDVLEIAIIENVQRADLNAIEEANGYRELIERFDYSQEQVSEIIGKSRSHVANTLRLLKLPAAVQAYVQDGRLTAGHARTLVGREDAEALAQRILEQNLNVREAEALAQTTGPIGVPGATGGGRKARDKDPDTKAFEKELADSLGLKVEVKRGSGESGNLIIKYGNFDQLDYIRLRLTGAPGG